MADRMESALETLRDFVHREPPCPEAAIESEARAIVLAVLAVGLRDHRPEMVELAEIGSMLLVPHRGGSARSWVALADRLDRMAAGAHRRVTGEGSHDS